MEVEQNVEDLAAQYCEQFVVQRPPPSDGYSYCAALWDGWGCWNHTRAGAIAFIECPSYIAGFDSTKQAYRNCTSGGEWWRAPTTNMTWANYTPCVDLGAIQEGTQVVMVYICGYMISIFCLIIALGIFTYFRQLQCPRVTIHQNLFVCYILNGVVWILYYRLVAMNSVVLYKNPLWCQVIHCLAQYFTTCNFFWMFCEGLYLHTVIIVTFVSGDGLLIMCHIIGWVFPVITTGLYAGFRAFSKDNATRCWLDDSLYSWIIFSSIVITLFLNLIFLCNILRVVITKLKAVNNPDSNQTRKAVRAALILIPLLGLQFALYPVQPSTNSSWFHLYSMITAAVTSFQGFFVALIFCYCNGEVISVIRRRWGQHRLMRVGSNMRTQMTSLSRGNSLENKNPHS